MEWTNLTKMLREERDLEIDSFIESTETGKQLYEICYEIHESNSLYFDLPSKGNYLGHVKIYPIICNEIDFKHILADIDVRYYSKQLIDVAISSTTEIEFMKSYHTLQKKLINF